METVICNQAGYCPELMCGGKEPHLYDENECGHCPKHPDAECIEMPEEEATSPQIGVVGALVAIAEQLEQLNKTLAQLKIKGVVHTKEAQ